MVVIYLSSVKYLYFNLYFSSVLSFNIYYAQHHPTTQDLVSVPLPPKTISPSLSTTQYFHRCYEPLNIICNIVYEFRRSGIVCWTTTSQRNLLTKGFRPARHMGEYTKKEAVSRIMGSEH
jgi:hypothetical protein